MKKFLRNNSYSLNNNNSMVVFPNSLFSLPLFSSAKFCHCTTPLPITSPKTTTNKQPPSLTILLFKFVMREFFEILDSYGASPVANSSNGLESLLYQISFLNENSGDIQFTLDDLNQTLDSLETFEDPEKRLNAHKNTKTYKRRYKVCDWRLSHQEPAKAMHPAGQIGASVYNFS